MKKLLAFIFVLTAAANAGEWLGFYGVNDTINVSIGAKDSLGSDTHPDSVQISVYFGGLATPCYLARTGTDPVAASYIDSSIYGGTARYTFWSRVGLIDSNLANGNYNFNVKTWAYGLSYDNKYSFTKVGGVSTASDNFADVMGDTAFLTAPLKAGVPGRYLGVGTDGSLTALGSGSIVVGAFANNSITANALAGSAAAEIGDTLRDALYDSLITASTLEKAIVDSTRDAIGDTFNVTGGNVFAQVKAMDADVIDDAVIKDGSLDSSKFYETFYTKLFTVDLSGYSANAGDVGWYIKSLYDFTDGNGVDGIDADIAGLVAGSVDTSLLSVWAWNTFMTAPSVYQGVRDTILNTDTTGYGGDATIGGSIVSGGTGSCDVSALPDTNWILNNFVDTTTYNAMMAARSYVASDTIKTGDTLTTLANVISSSALSDSIEWRGLGSEFDTCTVIHNDAENANQFQTTIHAPTGTLKGQVISFKSLSGAYGEVLSATISGYDADSGFIYVGEGFNQAPQAGQVMRVWKDRGSHFSKTDRDSLLAGVTAIPDSLIANVDTLKWRVGPFAITQNASSANNLLDFLIGGVLAKGGYVDSTIAIPDSVVARIDSLLMALGYPGVSIAGHLTNDLFHQIGSYDPDNGYTLKYQLDSLGYSLGWPGVTRAGDSNYNLHAKIGDYTGGTSNVKTAIENISVGSCGGTGTESCTLSVHSGSDPIYGATFEVLNLAQTSYNGGPQSSDMDGNVIYLINVGSWVVRITANNYDQIIDTITVTRDSTWDFSAKTITWPAAPSGMICQVRVSTVGIAGVAVRGARLTITPRTSLGTVWKDTLGNIVIPSSQIGYTDVNGHASVNAYKSPLVTRTRGDETDSLKYDIELFKENMFKAKWDNWVIPDSTSYYLR